MDRTKNSKGLWKKNLRSITPYVPGEQPNQQDMIKLNTNENPYPPSPEVGRVLEEFEVDQLRLYPEPDSTELVEALARYYHLNEDQVYVGVGSDDVLAIAFMTFFNSQKPILFPDITYSFYDVWAELFRIPFECPSLDENFNLCREDYYKGNGGVVIANPNAPTGVLQDLDFLRDIIAHNQDVVVIIDEAYIDFADGSALCLLEEFDNLVIVQTFSKSRSLAGMRIGYAMGNQDLIRAMNDVRYSYNSYPMTRVSVALGVAALNDDTYFQKTKNQIIETREWTKKELKRLGFRFQDSKTNFIFTEHSQVSWEDIFRKLRDKHIYVRHFKNSRIENYLRISIGTQKEMEKLICELENILQSTA